MKNFDLYSEIQNYKPLNQREQAYVNELLDFLSHGKDQFVRTNLQKHVVASAYLLNSSLDKILLTHHKFLGIWLPFGGHSDGESNSLNVALREAREESGIEDIDTGSGEIFDIDIHTIPENPKKHEPEHKHIDIRFVFTTSSEHFVVSDESDELAWVPIEKFIRMLNEGDYYSGVDRIIPKLKSYIAAHKN